MPKDAMDLWERFGEPTWDFLVDVQIPLPEYFPYDIDDANCLAALMSKYRYGIEVRGDLESPDPDDPDKPLTWTKVGKILGRPVLPFRSFRQAFGEMSEDQFKKEITQSFRFPWHTSLQFYWYWLREELGPPEYCWYIWEGFDMPPYKEHELNNLPFLIGRFTGEVRDAGFDGNIFATATWHSDQWLTFLTRCGTRAMVLVNNKHMCDRIMANQHMETALIWK